MFRSKAATVIVTGSLVMLIGGGTASAAWGGPVREDRVPSVVGLARGHVIVRDDLSPAGRGPISSAVERVAQTPEFSADARRELHAVTAPTARTPFSADALRELHSIAVPAAVTSFSVEARRELHSVAAPAAEASFSAEARRELHSRATATTSAEMQGTRLSEYAEAMQASSATTTSADVQGQRLSGYAEAMRELHSEAPATQSPEANGSDDLSPLGGGR